MSSNMRAFWLGIKSVIRTARQLINRNLEPLDLTGPEGDVLYHLLSIPEELEECIVTQEDLAIALDVGKAAISRTVDQLVKKAYVKRSRHPHDARAYHLQLSAKARTIGDEILKAYNSVYELAKKDIPSVQFEELASLLKHVEEALLAGDGDIDE